MLPSLVWCDRLALLAECFAISVYSFAVMSNHCHVVVAVEPDRAKLWSDEEIPLRWARMTQQRDRYALMLPAVSDE
jgi:hypothetical protein